MDGLIVLGIFFGAPLLCIIVIKVCFAVQNYKDKKLHEQHKEYFDLNQACCDLMAKRCKYQKENIKPLKTLIDNIVGNWKYYPEEMRKNKANELELYRRKIQEHQLVVDAMAEEELRLREHMKAYNAIHHIYKEP